MNVPLLQCKASAAQEEEAFEDVPGELPLLGRLGLRRCRCHLFAVACVCVSVCGCVFDMWLPDCCGLSLFAAPCVARQHPHCKHTFKVACALLTLPLPVPPTHLCAAALPLHGFQQLVSSHTPGWLACSMPTSASFLSTLPHASFLLCFAAAEDFEDPLLGGLMRDPVRLPSGEVWWGSEWGGWNDGRGWKERTWP